MGLGKTLQSLAVASYYFEKWPILIITTKTGTITWKSEIEKWMSEPMRDRFDIDLKAPIEDYIQIIDNNEDDDYDDDDDECAEPPKIVICSYGQVRSNLKRFLEQKYRFIIVDESQYIKNKDAQRTKAVLKLSRSCEHMLLLSGTPALSYPAELYPQIKAVNRDLFESAKEYEERYCVRAYFENDYQANSAENIEELRLILDQVLLRREKIDLPNHFPSKMRRITKIDPNLENETVAAKLKVAKRKYLRYKKMEQIEKSLARKTKIVKKTKKHLNTFIGQTCETKLIPVCLYAKKLLEEERKFVIVAFHNKMLDALEDICKINGFEYIKIDGKTPLANREEQLNEYYTNERIKIAILSLNTMYSLTLTGKNEAFIRHWYITSN